MALSIFTPSVSGMEAQSHAIGTSSTNLANIRTVGYKSTSTMFYTLLGSRPLVQSNGSGNASSRADVDGVGYYDRTDITRNGIVTPTGKSFDVAINGNSNAFFALKDSGGNTYYSRAGDFSTRTEGGVTYVVNNSGYKLQGFPATGNGTFSGSLSDLIVQYPDKVPSTPTSKVEVTANVPASGVDTSSYGITVYGPNNDGKTMNMVFNKVEGQNNAWDLDFNIDGGTVTTAGPIEAIFDSNGKLLSPKEFNVTVTWDDGSTNNIAMDISHMTQLAGGSGTTNISQDGNKSGDFVKSYIDNGGVLKALYSNGDTRDCGKIALVGFESPDNLIPVSGTMFEASNDTGATHYVMGPDTNNKNILVPEAVEASNVNVEQEFSNLIVIQRAYTLNSNAFTVADEMTSTAINLKA